MGESHIVLVLVVVLVLESAFFHQTLRSTEKLFFAHTHRFGTSIRVAAPLEHEDDDEHEDD